MIAQVEIFGPVLVAMTFRTPEESVALANNTPYGLAASLWTESINLALDIAPKLKSGVVWINPTNPIDASAGFGGHRERGLGSHDRAGRGLRPCARRDDVSHAGRIRRAREQPAVRSRGQPLGREHQPRARHRAEAEERRGMDQLHEPVRRVGGIRRLP